MLHRGSDLPLDDAHRDATASGAALCRRDALYLLLFLLFAFSGVWQASVCCRKDASAPPATSCSLPKENGSRLVAAFTSNNGCYSDSSRSRSRDGGRIFRLNSVGRGVSSVDRRSTLTAAFHLFFDRFGLAPELFRHVWLETATVRPLWLYLLTLRN